MTALGATNFLQDIQIYVGRVREFKRQDWLVYIAWNGLMFGLLFAVSFFLLAGHLGGVSYPGYVWNVPLGTAFFVGAIALDTIGHRTIYKPFLDKGEALIHHITIFAGITSVLALCLAYKHGEFMRVPTLVLIALSIIYSLFDEALHWFRYMTQKSDRVEMWSHFFIMFGHLTMILSWWHWFDQGYPGVQATLEVLSKW